MARKEPKVYIKDRKGQMRKVKAGTKLYSWLVKYQTQVNKNFLDLHEKLGKAEEKYKLACKSNALAEVRAKNIEAARLGMEEAKKEMLTGIGYMIDEVFFEEIRAEIPFKGDEFALITGSVRTAFLIKNNEKLNKQAEENAKIAEMAEKVKAQLEGRKTGEPLPKGVFVSGGEKELKAEGYVKDKEPDVVEKMPAKQGKVIDINKK
jgi:hypothetical protein